MNTPYVGSELDLFAGARNWKAYWSSILAPYLGRKVLDVGAGIGATARVFASRKFDRYLALEPDAVLVARMLQEGHNGAYPGAFEARQGTSEALGDDEYFDTILYIDVLEHIAGDDEELARISAHLLPGGCIVVLSPAHQWLFSAFDHAIGHVRRYDKASLLSVNPPGLNAERVFYLDSVGMAASLGNRLVLRSAFPSARQIALWDGWMIPLSKGLDQVTRFTIGKSIVGIFRKPEDSK